MSPADSQGKFLGAASVPHSITACTVCPKAYTSSEGAAECHNCGDNQIVSLSDRLVCEDCPVNRVAEKPRQLCPCGPGYYGNFSQPPYDTCYACPFPDQCLGANLCRNG